MLAASALAVQLLGAARVPADAAWAMGTDRLIVKYRGADAGGQPTEAELGVARVAANRQGVQFRHLRRTGLGADVLKLDRRVTLAQARALARDLQAGDARVEYAEPDRILRPLFTPNDSLYGQQWDLFEGTGGINLPTAWDKSTGAGVVVAVVDTGVRPHADLTANLLPGYDFIIDTVVSNDGNGRDADPSDPGDAVAADFCYSGSPAANSTWHGTHVAGTIAAVTNNGAGVAGVAYGAKVLPVRAVGRCGGYTSDIADGMVWAAGGGVSGVPANGNPARVINVSLGGPGTCDTTTQNAIQAARARGAVVVVAAGNENLDASQYTPASCSGVITVAATGRQGGKASYSNYGAVVSIAAPGGDGSDGIISTFNTGTSAPGTDSYIGYLGTSMATPHVSAVAALMLARNPTLTPDELLKRLKASARPFPVACIDCGAGIVDANAAVDAAAVVSVAAVGEVEPNNTAKTAQTVSVLPALVSGSMASGSDTDYFKFTVASGKKLVATLTPNASSNYDLYLYNAAGRLLSISTRGSGQVDTIAITNSGASTATVSVRVVYVSGLTGAGAGSYTLYLSNN